MMAIGFGGKLMTAKEYLQQAFYIDRKIDISIKKVEEMKRSLYGKSISYENDGTQNGSHANGTENSIMRVLEYEETINADIDKLVNLWFDIEKSIEQVSDKSQKEILTRRYLLFEKWEKIAVDMDITFQWAHILHKRALKQVKIPATVDCN